VGLRFSLVHLRLAGYGLIGVWLSETVSLLTSPLLQEVGTRLHYVSQALDLAPLLLVGLVLVAFQGGLQRSGLERRLLPLLFALLPLLSAFYLLMVPASIGNALTLGSKQLEVSREQLRSIESQLDRADTVLLKSQDIEDLRRRLDAIPGVRLKATPNISLQEAQREIAEALQTERRRVRTTISTNTALARAQFNRRATQNAMLATVVGGVLAWMRIASLREMGLSATYLSWAITADPQAARASGLQSLLGFQNDCLATSYMALIESLLQLGSNQAERERREREQQEEKAMLERLSKPLPEPTVPAPWEQGIVEVRSEAWRRTAGMFRGLSPPGPLSTPDPDEERAYQEWLKQQEGGGEVGLSPWQRRRVRHDRERMRVAMEGFARNVSAFTPGPQAAESSVAPWNWRRRPSQRQLRKARQALERFAAQFEDELSPVNGPDPAKEPEAGPTDRQSEASNQERTNQPDDRSGPGGPTASP
jgi:ABC-type multidrug transport system fused ATPase/permease subunit